jgi:hypothetical protein
VYHAGATHRRTDAYNHQGRGLRVKVQEQTRIRALAEPPSAVPRELVLVRSTVRVLSMVRRVHLAAEGTADH